jgi:HAD superfamily hydrolase (TIGR01484 family)
MSEIKLVLTDLDGTVVVPAEHTVSQRVVSSIDAAENQGVRVCAVTGRYFELSRQVLKAIGFRHLCVFDGGATIANPLTGEVIWEEALSVSKIEGILSILAPHSQIMSLGHGRDNDFDPDYFERNAIDTPASHIWASVPAKVAPRLMEMINHDPEVIAHGNIAPYGDRSWVGVQVTAKKADKEHGVARLLSLLGVAPENVLAIGDGDNDLPLFRSAGLRIAMGNATEELKAAADAVVGRVEDDGFAEAIQQYVLN